MIYRFIFFRLTYTYTFPLHFVAKVKEEKEI